MMGPEVVMRRYRTVILRGGDDPEIMRSLAVSLVVGFLDGAPLYRDIVGVIEVDHLVIAPAYRQMVEDDVVRSRLLRSETAHLDAVSTGAAVTIPANAQIANDDVVNAMVVA